MGCSSSLAVQGSGAGGSGRTINGHNIPTTIHNQEQESGSAGAKGPRDREVDGLGVAGGKLNEPAVQKSTMVKLENTTAPEKLPGEDDFVIQEIRMIQKNKNLSKQQKEEYIDMLLSTYQGYVAAEEDTAVFGGKRKFLERKERVRQLQEKKERQDCFSLGSETLVDEIAAFIESHSEYTEYPITLTSGTPIAADDALFDRIFSIQWDANVMADRWLEKEQIKGYQFDVHGNFVFVLQFGTKIDYTPKIQLNKHAYRFYHKQVPCGPAFRQMIRAACAGLKQCFFRTVDRVTTETIDLMSDIFRFDYPELWHWTVENQYMTAMKGDYVVRYVAINQNDYKLNTVLQLNKQLSKTADTILANVQAPAKSLTPLEQLNVQYKIYDYLTGTIQYNLTPTDQQKLKHIRTAVGGLIYKQCVCAGVAYAFKYLADVAGLKVGYTTGNAGSEPHAWNVIKIEKNYYHLDATWDLSEKRYIYRYFNFNDRIRTKTRTVNEKPQTPACILMKYNHFENEGCRISDNSDDANVESQFREILKKKVIQLQKSAKSELLHFGVMIDVDGFDAESFFKKFVYRDIQMEVIKDTNINFDIVNPIYYDDFIEIPIQLLNERLFIENVPSTVDPQEEYRQVLMRTLLKLTDGETCEVQIDFEGLSDLSSFDFYRCKNDIVYEHAIDFQLEEIKYVGRYAFIKMNKGGERIINKLVDGKPVEKGVWYIIKGKMNMELKQRLQQFKRGYSYVIQGQYVRVKFQ